MEPFDSLHRVQLWFAKIAAPFNLQMLLAVYLDRIGHAIVSKSGHEVAAFISLASVHVQVELESLSLEQIDQICRSKLARLETFGDIICNIVKARKHLTNQQTIEAYKCEIAALVYVPLFIKSSHFYWFHRGLLLQQTYGNFSWREQLGSLFSPCVDTGHSIDCFKCMSTASKSNWHW